MTQESEQVICGVLVKPGMALDQYLLLQSKNEVTLYSAIHRGQWN